MLFLVGVIQLFPVDSQLEVFKSEVFNGRGRTVFLTRVEIFKSIGRTAGSLAAFLLVLSIPSVDESSEFTKVIFAVYYFVLGSNNLFLLLLRDKYRRINGSAKRVMLDGPAMRLTVTDSSLKWFLLAFSIIVSLGLSAYDATGISYFMVQSDQFSELNTLANLGLLIVFNIFVTLTAW